MTSNADVRKAHGLLDVLASEMNVKTENVTLLRSLIPALPAQMALEEITNDVYEAWIASSGDEWVRDGGGSVISLEDWLKELHAQLQGLAPAKPGHPEFLETAADYESAPVGTIVSIDGVDPWVKGEGIWVHVSAANKIVFRVPCLGGRRRVSTVEVCCQS